MKLNMDFVMAVEMLQFLQKRNSRDYIQAEKIAEELNFSTGYLQKVIQLLSKHGTVETKRGRIGGIRLGRGKVTLLDVWNMACGPMDTGDVAITHMNRPVKAFETAMKKIVVCG